MIIVRIEHARAIKGVCSAGMRRYAERLGIDWGEFLKNGCPVHRFDPLKNDYYIEQLIRNAKNGRI